MNYVTIEQLRKYYHKGINKVTCCNPEKRKSRLEYVLEQHPDVDKDKISIPSEIYDVQHFMRAEDYRNASSGFRNGINITGISTLTAIVLGKSFMSRQGISSENSDVNVFLGIGCWLAACYAIASSAMTAYYYRTLNRAREKLEGSIFSEPLTERERALSNYVNMNG